MAKGLAISALIIAILALFVPVLSIFVSIIACFLALAAAVAGEKPLSSSTAVLVLFNSYIFSPFNWIALAGNGGGPIKFAASLCGAILLVVIVRTIVDGMTRPQPPRPRIR